MTPSSLSNDVHYVACRSGIVAVTLMACTTIPAPSEPFMLAAVHYLPINASTEIRFAPLREREYPPQGENEYQPRTDFGRKLMALRRTYIENGGILLDEAALEAEIRARRGGVDV